MFIKYIFIPTFTKTKKKKESFKYAEDEIV